MNDKHLVVKVFNNLRSNLRDQDISTWKNIELGNKKVVPPGGGPAEFSYERKESQKELKITADPLRNNQQKALLNLTLSSTSDFTVTVQLKQEEKKDKWVLGFKEMIPAPDFKRFENPPPVVNVSVGEDEDPGPL